MLLVLEDLFKRSEHFAQKVCQVSTLWLDQLLGARIKIHPPRVQLACGTITVS